MKHITPYLNKFWQWLTNRKLEVEHIGMGAVILISTWHVSQHMETVEGSAVVAVIMGAVLGFLNAVFAMRFFEERKETRRPAGVGVLFFAAVSIWMQYGFYDENSDLVRYDLLGININALAFGAWAPISEILLGWLYGVRLWVRGEQGAAINAIAAEYEKKLTALQQKFDSQLTATQRALDEVSIVKSDLRQAQALMAGKDASIAALQSTIADLRVSKASIEGKLSAINTNGLTPTAPAIKGNQLPVKLTTADRRNRIVEIVRDGRIVEDGQEKPVTISGLARILNAAVNTIKADLKELEPVIEVNGSIHLRGSR